VEPLQYLGCLMEVGSLVRHKKDGDLGIVTWVGGPDPESRITFICADGLFWRTYRRRVDVICK
jgi:hypothetical protein